MIAFTCFGILIYYLMITAMWSPSVVYRDEKLLRTAILPLLFLIAGYMVARAGGLRVMAGVTVAAAALVYLLAPEDGFLDATAEDPIEYQRYGILVGAAAGCAVLLADKSIKGLALISLAAFFTYVAATSGGRLGVVLAAIGLLVRMPLLAVPAAASVVAAYIWWQDIGDYLLATVDIDSAVFRAVNVTFGQLQVDYSLREDFTADAWRVFMSEPLLGVGWGGFPVAAGYGDAGGHYPHNIVLELLSETGVVGAMLCVYALLAVLLLFALSTRQRPQGVVWGFIAMGLALAMFVGDFHSQGMLFMSVGMALGTMDQLADTESKAAA